MEELIDRQLRNEQQYFHRLNDVFTRLEELEKQNKILIKAIEEQSCSYLLALKKYNQHFIQTVEDLEKRSQEANYMHNKIELLQEEITHHTHALVNAQAEIVYLRSRHPKAKIRKFVERFGFLISPLLPISLLRRSKRMVRKVIRG
jgi:hypothetical protein